MKIWSSFTWSKTAQVRSLVVVFGLVLIVVIIRLALHKKNIRDERPLGIAVVPNTLPSDLDSDHDGLKDWEEALYHTDPQNPDTDGDGTPDGEEIKQNRDPLKAGPNDFIATTTPEVNTEAPIENVTQNLTSIFTEKYFRAKGRNLNTAINPKGISESAVLDFLNQENITTAFPHILSQELKTAPDNSVPAVKQYYNTLAIILEKNFRKDLPNPLLLFTSIIQNNDYTSQLYRFDPYIGEYKKIVGEIKKVAVPSRWETRTESYLNILLKISEIVRSFRHTDQDIIRALVMANIYSEIPRELAALQKQIQTQLKEEKITFSPGEPAVKFLEL